jgi:hypothetical protein
MKIFRLFIIALLVNLLFLGCKKSSDTSGDPQEFDSLSPEDNALIESWSVENPDLNKIIGSDGFPLARISNNERVTGSGSQRDALIKAMLTEAQMLSGQKIISYPEQGVDGPFHMGLVYSGGQRNITQRLKPLAGNSIHKKYAVYGTDCSGLIFNLLNNNGFTIGNFSVASFKTTLESAVKSNSTLGSLKVKELIIPSGEIKSGDFIVWLNSTGNHMGICYKTTYGSNGIYQSNGTALPATEVEQTKNLGKGRGVHPISLKDATTGTGYWGNGYSIIRLVNDEYKGMVSQTSIVPFGGSPYCKYDVQFRDIQITIGSELDNSDLNLIFEERTVGSCPYLPGGIINMKFKGTVVKTSSNDISIQYSPVAPATNDLKVSFKGRVNNDKILGTLTIVRTNPVLILSYGFGIDIELNN